MDRHNVRVVEVGDRAGLGQIGFGILGLETELAMRNLDGDEAAATGRHGRQIHGPPKTAPAQDRSIR